MLKSVMIGRTCFSAGPVAAALSAGLRVGEEIDALTAGRQPVWQWEPPPATGNLLASSPGGPSVFAEGRSAGTLEIAGGSVDRDPQIAAVVLAAVGAKSNCETAGRGVMGGVAALLEMNQRDSRRHLCSSLDPFGTRSQGVTFSHRESAAVTTALDSGNQSKSGRRL
jgi:hypothetical protein